jgi:two-component system nitrogen regulation response regulator GlnG
MRGVLVNDDDPGQLVADLRKAFAASGYRIAMARTGAEGVAHVRAVGPDVVPLNLH